MAETIEKKYSLRNDEAHAFDIEAEVTKSGKTGDKGAEITAHIRGGPDLNFSYVVEFGGDFVKTKENFTPEMYLLTALSIIESQLESKRYLDTKLSVLNDSGLTLTDLTGNNN